jgi:Tfp pilus assembly protein PilF
VIRSLERSSRRLTRRRKYAAAERRLRAWLALDPEAEKPKVRLALLAVSQGRKHLARRKTRMASIHAKAALKWVPGSPSAWELLGDIARKKRNLGHALKAYEQALKAEKISRRQKRRVKKKIKKTKRRLK